MKIAILNIYSGLVTRGAETVSDALAREWTKLGHDVDLIAGGTIQTREYTQHVIPEISIISTEESNFMNKLKLLIRLPGAYEQMLIKFTKNSISILNEINPDIILACNGSFQSQILSRSNFANKTIALLQGQSQTQFWKLGGNENRRLLNSEIAGFIILNPQLYDWAKNKFPNKRIIQLPNGVEFEFFNNHPNPNSQNILCVAGLQKFKQIDLLIKAVSKLSDFTLTIIGQGPEEQNLRNLISTLQIQDRVTITICSHDLIHQYYQQAQVFSLPSSKSEAFGVAYLEAMASGLPVVAANDELRKYIIGDAGILTDVYDSNQYSHSLKTAMETNWQNKPKQQAEKFRWEPIAEDYIKFFKSIPQ